MKRDNIVGYLGKSRRPRLDLLAGQMSVRKRQRAVLRRAVLSNYYFRSGRAVIRDDFAARRRRGRLTRDGDGRGHRANHSTRGGI